MCVCTQYVCAYGGQLRESEKGVRSHGTSVTEGCELQCGYWERNQGSLQENMLLTT